MRNQAENRALIAGLSSQFSVGRACARGCECARRAGGGARGRHDKQLRHRAG
ncbi:hypothetical protein [Lysobacter gummosus]|uniref:hypothetical protein n=1 Tax=Lysobacter gummosus TaxID=262324 RepID=UPI0036333F5D